MSRLSIWISGLLEGVGIALESIKSNRVRAALTILGVAVGVFVVVVISAAIHGINASVAKDFESAAGKVMSSMETSSSVASATVTSPGFRTFALTNANSACAARVWANCWISS